MFAKRIFSMFACIVLTIGPCSAGWFDSKQTKLHKKLFDVNQKPMDFNEVESSMQDLYRMMDSDEEKDIVGKFLTAYNIGEEDCNVKHFEELDSLVAKHQWGKTGTQPKGGVMSNAVSGLLVKMGELKEICKKEVRDNVNECLMALSRSGADELGSKITSPSQGRFAESLANFVKDKAGNKIMSGWISSSLDKDKYLDSCREYYYEPCRGYMDVFRYSVNDLIDLSTKLYGGSMTSGQELIKRTSEICGERGDACMNSFEALQRMQK